MDIGATLRETRIRHRISIETVEEDTKIRPKYLRALENEEWDLLPGPSYVRTFLRTYAQYLGLDAQMVLDEYRRAHESHEDRGGYTEPVLRERPMRGPRGPRLSRTTVAIGGAVLLIVALYVIGTLFPDAPGDESKRQQAATTASKSSQAGSARERKRAQAKKRAAKKRAAAAKIATVSIKATGPVYVCLVNAKGSAVVKGRTLATGNRLGPYKSSQFKAVFGNGNLKLAVSGKKVTVPGLGGGFKLLPKGRKTTLPPAQRPNCQ